MNKIIFILILPFFQLSCKETKTVYIADHQVDCEGIAMQKCMLFRENPDGEWTYFYDAIQGFEYEEGYTYQIKVSIENVENPPADASSLQYTLIKIISKEKSSPTISAVAATQDAPPLVIYTASSRGSFIGVEINQEVIKKFTDRNLQDFNSKSCSQKDWNTILSYLKDIRLQKISELEAPSQKRLFDGAAHAELKITSGGVTYTSNGFDHGHPPEELKQLVITILSLAESIE